MGGPFFIPRAERRAGEMSREMEISNYRLDNGPLREGHRSAAHD